MLAETLTATGAVATGGFLYAKSRRAQLYGELTSRVAQITGASAPCLTVLPTLTANASTSLPPGLQSPPARPRTA
jgi:hypothetical protein